MLVVVLLPLLLLLLPVMLLACILTDIWIRLDACSAVVF
jgi:hypothetical protein